VLGRGRCGNKNVEVVGWTRLSKTMNAGKDRKQEEKGTTEDEMVGWHH